MSYQLAVLVLPLSQTNVLPGPDSASDSPSDSSNDELTVLVLSISQTNARVSKSQHRFYAEFMTHPPYKSRNIGSLRNSIHILHHKVATKVLCKIPDTSPALVSLNGGRARGPAVCMTLL